LSSRAPYLPFIDGLRAVAVLAVVAFHVSPAQLPGGYLGVDIFFVISGYLILGRLGDDLACGHLGLSWALDFARRRALRIFPPLALVLAATAASMVLFPVLPSEAEGIRQSLSWAAFFLANHYFAADTGYFAAAAESKPLLHIWSLAIEEQFYLLAAGLVLLARGVRNQALALRRTAIGLAAASLALWVATPAASDMAAFYFLPWRAWEFLAGGLAAALVRRWQMPAVLGLAGAGLALLGILVSDGASFRLGALLTTAGTVIVLLAPQRLAVALTLPPARWIGRLSYGWYLWHWPVLFFARTLTPAGPSLLVDVVAAGLALGLAWATHHAVERPLLPLRRAHGWTTWREATAIAAATSTLGLAVVGASAAHTQAKLQQKSMAVELKRAARYQDAALPATLRGDGALIHLGGGDRRLIAWGDSFILSISSTLAETARRQGIAIEAAWSPSCAPLLGSPLFVGRPRYRASCDLARARAKAEAPGWGNAGLILAGDWTEHFRDEDFSAALDATLAALVQPGRRILIVAQTATFPILHQRQCAQRAVLGHRDVGRCVAPRNLTLRPDIVAQLEAMAVRHEGVRVVDLGPAFCDADTCRVGLGGRLMFVDDKHLNPDGGGYAHAALAPHVSWLLGHSDSALADRDESSR
jgi:peptidoglycan/LPS O-acetylase OafA/YrhL